jgi:hypothetical protein
MGILAACHNLNQLWIVHMTRGSKESEKFKELVEKVNPKILYLSHISYDIATGVIGATIIFFVGLDISKPIFWIGLAIISYSFTVVLLSASNYEKKGRKIIRLKK